MPELKNLIYRAEDGSKEQHQSHFVALTSAPVESQQCIQSDGLRLINTAAL